MGDRYQRFLRPLGNLFLRLTNRTIIRKSPCAISHAATSIHRACTVMDLHCDAVLANRNLLKRSHRGHVDLPRLQEGNIALQVFSVPTVAPIRAGIPWIPSDADTMGLLVRAFGWPDSTYSSTFQRALHGIHLLRNFEKNAEGRFEFIEFSDELEDFLKKRETDPDRVAGLLALEGLHCLEGNLEALDIFYSYGVRTAGLVHLGDNDLGGSAHGRRKCGITDFGKSVVQRMEDLKMVVDLAHASPTLIEDVLNLATRPVIISHTGLKGTHNNDRNISDDHARRIAEKGGIIGIGFFPWAIGKCSLNAIVNTIHYAISLVGADHVALGSDFDGMVTTPLDASGMAFLTEALWHAGISAPDIYNIMGGNAVRFFKEALPQKNQITTN